MTDLPLPEREPNGFNNIPNPLEQLDALQARAFEGENVDVLNEFQVNAVGDNPLRAGAETFVEVLPQSVGSAEDLDTLSWRLGVALDPEYLKAVTATGRQVKGTTEEKWVAGSQYAAKVLLGIRAYQERYPDQKDVTDALFDKHYRDFTANPTGINGVLMGVMKTAVTRRLEFGKPKRHRRRPDLPQPRSAMPPAESTAPLPKSKYHQMMELFEAEPATGSDQQFRTLENLLLITEFESPLQALQASRSLHIKLLQGMSVLEGASQAQAFGKLIAASPTDRLSGMGTVIKLTNLLLKKSDVDKEAGIFDGYGLGQLSEREPQDYLRAVDRLHFVAAAELSDSPEFQERRHSFESMLHCVRLGAQAGLPRRKLGSQLGKGDLRVRYPHADPQQFELLEELAAEGTDERIIHGRYRSQPRP